MEISKLLTGIGPYDQAKLDKTEADAKKARIENAAVSAKTGDTINVSDEGRLRTEAYSSATRAPEVRQDLVAEIKARIAAGTYQIDPKKIAATMVKEDMDLLM